MQRLWIVLFSVLLLVVSIPAVIAQDGFSETGSITSAEPEVDYKIQLERGESIMLLVEMLEDTLDPMVSILDPNDELVATNDDIEQGMYRNSRLIYSAAMTGMYTVRVHSWGDTRGDYRLTITPLVTDYFEDKLEADGVALEYTVELESAQVITVTLHPTDNGRLPQLSIIIPNGEEIAHRDDPMTLFFGSALQIGYQAIEAGTYTIVVTAQHEYEEYLLSITHGGAVSPNGRPQLDGQVRFETSEHFVYHYTLEGENATNKDFVEMVAEVGEEVWDIEINQMGWAEPVLDSGVGGDSRYDVYLLSMCGRQIGGSSAYAYSAPEGASGDNPNTDYTETGASASHIVLDNDFDDGCSLGASREEVLAVFAHEFHHSIQHGLDTTERNRWVYESTATWIETQVVPESYRANYFVPDVFNNPHVCFGTDDGYTEYGTYLFIQSLVDMHGVQIVHDLWDNIARYDGFDALEQTMEAYDDDFPSAVARYWLQNLVRAYPLGDYLYATVRLEDTIDELGAWSDPQFGIQELGVDFVQLDLDQAEYSAVLDGSDGENFELFAIGIRGDQAEAFRLESGDSFSTEGYSEFYLMIFNPHYDEDLSACSAYDDFTITLDTASRATADVLYTWDTVYFTPLS
jgi:hypothetical protein